MPKPITLVSKDTALRCIALINIQMSNYNIFAVQTPHWDPSLLAFKCQISCNRTGQLPHLATSPLAIKCQIPSILQVRQRNRLHRPHRHSNTKFLIALQVKHCTGLHLHRHSNAKIPTALQERTPHWASCFFKIRE